MKTLCVLAAGIDTTELVRLGVPIVAFESLLAPFISVDLLYNRAAASKSPYNEVKSSQMPDRGFLHTYIVKLVPSLIRSLSFKTHHRTILPIGTTETDKLKAEQTVQST